MGVSRQGAKTQRSWQPLCDFAPWRETLLYGTLLAAALGCAGGHGKGELLIKNENAQPVTVWIYQAVPGASPKRYDWTNAGSIPPGGEHTFSKEIENLGAKGRLRLQPGGGPVKGVAVDPSAFDGGKATVTVHADETLALGPGTKAAPP